MRHCSLDHVRLRHETSHALYGMALVDADAGSSSAQGANQVMP